MNAPGSRIALSAYRPRDGRDAELVELFREELATLRRGGHVTARPAPICRTDRGELLVILEWVTATSVDEAHRDPAVLAVWERKAELAEYVGPASLEGSDRPFVSYQVIDEA